MSKCPEDRGHLFGDWKGGRERLLERGVDIDLQYLSDSLWNLRSPQRQRLASWNRVRGTVNLDLSRLTGAPGLTFHITGLWQGGGNLGTYLGAIANPSSMASGNTFRLDSYWIEEAVGKRKNHFPTRAICGRGLLRHPA